MRELLPLRREEHLLVSREARLGLGLLGLGVGLHPLELVLQGLLQPRVALALYPCGLRLLLEPHAVVALEGLALACLGLGLGLGLG